MTSNQPSIQPFGAEIAYLHLHLYAFKAILYLILGSIFLTSGCSLLGLLDPPIKGSGVMTIEERSLNAFDAVDLVGIGQVNIQIGEEQQVTVTVDDNVAEYLETEVSGGELSIYFSHSVVDVDQTVDIVMEAVTALTLTGSGTIDATGSYTGSTISIRNTGSGTVGVATISTTDFSAQLTGSGEIDLGSVSATSGDIENTGSGDITIGSLDLVDLEVNLSGSGDIQISDGNSEECTVDNSGSGRYLAAGFVCDDAEVDLLGSGNIYIWAVTSLDVLLLGSGSIYYSGSPSITVSDLGSGNLRPAQ